MRSFVYGLILALPLILISCTPPAADTAGFKKAVDEYNTQSTEDMMAGNSEKSIMYYGDNAVSMPPNEAAIMGRENIKAWQDGMTKMGIKITSAKFNTTDLQTSGNVGYETGTYDMSMEMGGKEMKDSGKYISTWMKQQDGSWKITAEIWNSSNPLPTPPEPPKQTSKKKK